MSIQFQSMMYTENLDHMTTKDWMFKLCHQFPKASVMTAKTIMELEGIAAESDLQTMQNRLKELIGELAVKDALAKSTEEIESRADSDDRPLRSESSRPAQQIKMLW
ncbi:hypothetical protein QTV44_002590 [Vibrio vulnificus]|nr:hypothetical protein [Vibrio vulnificus]